MTIPVGENRMVATDPNGELHFHTGRRAVAHLGDALYTFLARRP